MMKKYFTLEEANALIPAMQIEIEALQHVQAQFEGKYKELQIRKKMGKSNSDLFSLEVEMEFLQIEANTHLNNITQKGVELKGIEAGLIDFPSIIEGKEVLLCWKIGEPCIQHYHGPEDGFRGRKKL